VSVRVLGANGIAGGYVTTLDDGPLDRDSGHPAMMAAPIGPGHWPCVRAQWPIFVLMDQPLGQVAERMQRLLPATLWH
jgi:hypothetical protein